MQSKVFVSSEGLKILNAFTEIESGKKADRPQLNQAIQQVKEQGAVLVIAKLDRLARNVFFVSQLMDARIKFIACDMPEANEMTVQIMAVMAEQEARATSQRVKAALKAAKARGTKLGKPENLTKEAIKKSQAVRTEKARKAYGLVYGYVKTLREQAMSLAAIAERLNREGHRTRQGRYFKPMTIKRVLDRGEK